MNLQINFGLEVCVSDVGEDGDLHAQVCCLLDYGVFAEVERLVRGIYTNRYRNIYQKSEEQVVINHKTKV